MRAGWGIRPPDPLARNSVLLILGGGRKKRNKLKSIPATMSGWRGTCLAMVPAKASPRPDPIQGLTKFLRGRTR